MHRPALPRTLALAALACAVLTVLTVVMAWWSVQRENELGADGPLPLPLSAFVWVPMPFVLLGATVVCWRMRTRHGGYVMRRHEALRRGRVALEQAMVLAQVDVRLHGRAATLRHRADELAAELERKQPAGGVEQSLRDFADDAYALLADTRRPRGGHAPPPAPHDQVEPKPEWPASTGRRNGRMIDGPLGPRWDLTPGREKMRTVLAIWIGMFVMLQPVMVVEEIAPTATLGSGEIVGYVMVAVLIGGGYVVGIAVLLCLRRAVPR